MHGTRTVGVYTRMASVAYRPTGLQWTANRLPLILTAYILGCRSDLKLENRKYLGRRGREWRDLAILNVL